MAAIYTVKENSLHTPPLNFSKLKADVIALLKTFTITNVWRKANLKKYYGEMIEKKYIKIHRCMQTFFFDLIRLKTWYLKTPSTKPILECKMKKLRKFPQTLSGAWEQYWKKHGRRVCSKFLKRGVMRLLMQKKLIPEFGAKGNDWLYHLVKEHPEIVRGNICPLEEWVGHLCEVKRKYDYEVAVV